MQDCAKVSRSSVRRLRSERHVDAAHEDGLGHRETIVYLIAGGGQVLAFQEDVQPLLARSRTEMISGTGIEDGVILLFRAGFVRIQPEDRLEAEVKGKTPSSVSGSSPLLLFLY